MRKPFTLVEVLIAMSVLSVFLLGLMQFYSSTETVLSSGVERTEMFERARIAMDMMANDLTCIYYSQTDDDLTPFEYSENSYFQVSTIRPEKLNTEENKLFGTGKPIICVSVMDVAKEDIVAEVKRLIADKAEMIEWRVDALDYSPPGSSVYGILQARTRHLAFGIWGCGCLSGS